MFALQANAVTSWFIEPHRYFKTVRHWLNLQWTYIERSVGWRTKNSRSAAEETQRLSGSYHYSCRLTLWRHHVQVAHHMSCTCTSSLPQWHISASLRWMAMISAELIAITGCQTRAFPASEWCVKSQPCSWKSTQFCLFISSYRQL